MPPPDQRFKGESLTGGHVHDGLVVVDELARFYCVAQAQRIQSVAEQALGVAPQRCVDAAQLKLGDDATGERTEILELGGNGPMVVMDDADLALATDAALEAAYLCAGQSCTAGERFLVHSAVRAEFVERVVEATAARVRLGDPFDPETTMGPLNNEATAAKFDQHVGDAVSRGAKLCIGGSRESGRPTTLYAEATVIDGVTREMVIAREETFGPVVPVLEVASMEEAIALTNSTPFGLTAAVFTADLERGLAFAEAVRAGWVNINASTNLWESHLPFGGRSGSVSGRGRVGGRSVMDTFTEPKTVVFPAPRS